MDKMNINFFQKLIRFYKFIYLFIYLFHDLLWYCHMRSEIIQIIASDNYDGFQQLNFIFSRNFISLF